MSTSAALIRPFVKRQTFESATTYNWKTFLLNGPPEGTIDDSTQLYFPNIEFRPVETVEEFELAMRLIHDEYMSAGLIKPKQFGKSLNLSQLLPGTVTFVAKHKKHGILATLSVVEDSPLGLPLEKIYEKEVQALRSQGYRLAEYTMFAVDRNKLENGASAMSASQRFIMLCHLIRSSTDYMRSATRINAVVECCHPSHDGFYKLLGLERFGDLKRYRAVRGNPALARVMYFKKAFEEGNLNTSHRLFCGMLPMDNRARKRLHFSPFDIERLFVRETNVLAMAAPNEIEYIKARYPECNFETMLRRRSLIDYLFRPARKF